MGKVQKIPFKLLVLNRRKRHGGVEDTGRHRGRETKRERKRVSVLNDGASVWHAHASWA